MPRPGDEDRWIEREPGLRACGREVARLLGRGWHRAAITIPLALLLTAVPVAKLARAPGRATARLLFRLSESDLELGASDLPERRLREYVSDVALSTTRLTALIRRFDLAPQAMARGDEIGAVAALRDQLGIRVYRNDLLQDRSPGDAPRTARLELEFSHPVPETAREVGRALGALVAEEATTSRVDENARKLREARAAEEAALQDYLSLRTRLGKAQRDLEAAEPGEHADELRLEVGQLRGQVDSRTARMVVTGAQRADLELRERLDRQELGLRFELADERLDVRAPITVERLALVAILVLGISWLLVAIGVGAFDPRVHDRRDVERLGIEVVGTLPPSPRPPTGRSDAGPGGARDGCEPGA